MNKKKLLNITSTVVLTAAIVLTFWWKDWQMFTLFMLWLTGYGAQLKAGDG